MENTTACEMGDSWQFVTSCLFGMGHIGNHIPDVDQSHVGDLAFHVMNEANNGIWDTDKFISAFSVINNLEHQMDAYQIYWAVQQSTKAFVQAKMSY
ncbi:expressed unknown protein [Seminavis robusta]|uniref:Uncharacterized protein n=1 Tax=Seminavis robusta TaxID=568900 RepID=A0A9N8DE13_9STRA|nr:expressed unknown protein [Seminavis robusta]|eukprot:Sro99_g050760.1 n/a (97) ;mRNA; r:21863-22153